MNSVLQGIVKNANYLWIFRLQDSLNDRFIWSNTWAPTKNISPIVLLSRMCVNPRLRLCLGVTLKIFKTLQSKCHWHISVSNPSKTLPEPHLGKPNRKNWSGGSYFLIHTYTKIWKQKKTSAGLPHKNMYSIFLVAKSIIFGGLRDMPAI